MGIGWASVHAVRGAHVKRLDNKTVFRLLSGSMANFLVERYTRLNTFCAQPQEMGNQGSEPLGSVSLSSCRRDNY